MMVRKKFLTLSFLHSNDGLVQIFGGETAKCVCQGLTIFLRKTLDKKHMYDNKTHSVKDCIVSNRKKSALRL